MDKRSPESRRRHGRNTRHPAQDRLLAPVIRPVLLLLLLCAAFGARAQDTADALAPTVQPPYRVVPRVSVTETFTDNVNLSDNNRRADQITEISPGIRISRDTGHIRGYFDYALRAVAYAQNPHNTGYLNALSTAVEVEAVNQWLFLDFSGHIAQQSINGFGLLPGLNTYTNPNTAEFSTYQFAPRVQGSLGGLADYMARFSRTITHGNSALAPDVGESLGSVNLNGNTGLSQLGWLLDASRYDIDYSAGRATEADQTDAGLSWAFTPQLSGAIKAGREFSNYSTPEKQAYNTSDVSLNWQPSPQAQASASWGRRSFGDIHAVNLAYNAPLVQLRLSDRREVAAVPGQVLPLLLLPLQGPPVIANFVTTAVSVQSRRDLSLTLLGQRDTVTLAFSQSDVARLDTLFEGRLNLPAERVRQKGVSLDVQHRLTPRYELGLQALLQQSAGLPGQEDNLLRALSLNLQGKLWRQGLGSIGLRHVLATGSSSYNETALTLSLTVEF